jgi:hypothetical protein
MTVIGWGASGRAQDNGSNPENTAQLAAVNYAGSDDDLSYVNEDINFQATQSGTLQFGDSGDGLFYLDPAGRYELLGVLHDISRQTGQGVQRVDAFTRLDANSSNYPNFSEYIDTESAGEPAAPGGLTATSIARGVHVSWNPPSAPNCAAAAVTGYNVHIQGGAVDKVVQLPAGQISHNFLNLT